MSEGVQLERSIEKPLKIFSIKLTIFRLILICLIVIFYTSSLYFESKNLIAPPFTLVFVLILFFCFYLKKKKVLYFGEYNLEASEAGDIFITQLHGHCSKCDGHLKIIKTKKASFIQCDKDNNHVWNLFEVKNKEETLEKKID